tara:strand:+ start:14301 stop:14666 length:366 start_codon:yes stop_codon:yes gene_type:complete
MSKGYYNRTGTLQTGHGCKSGKTGPLKRKDIIKREIVELLDSGFFSEWRTSHEIAWNLNKKLSKHWTPMNGHTVGSLIRSYIKPYNIETFKKSRLKYYRVADGKIRGNKPPAANIGKITSD